MKLTPVAHMLHSSGLSIALSGRSRSSSPRASRLSRSATPRASASLAALPPDTTAAELLRDPYRALEFFKEQAGARWGLEERQALVHDHIMLAKTLHDEAKDVRSAVAGAKQHLASLRPDESETAASANEAARTLSPEELSTINEIDGLRARFQELTWEMWRVKAEVDKLERSLGADAVQMQREFESWFKWLRRQARSHRAPASQLNQGYPA